MTLRERASKKSFLASMAFLVALTMTCLHSVQAAKRTLDPLVDQVLKLGVLGAELQLVSKLELADRKRELQDEIQKNSALYGGLVNQRILKRQQGDVSPASMKSVDPLGYVIDCICVDSNQALDLILKNKYYGLLLQLLPKTCGRIMIYLDLDEGSLTLFDQEGVTHVRGLTPLLRSLLFHLAQGPHSKEELIQKVWKYSRYHPLHHDSVVYQAVTGLRKLLGDRASWIETTEKGYRLRIGVELRSHEKGKQKLPQLVVKEEIIQKPVLNHRQIRFLRQMKNDEFTHVHDYRKKFKVSEITACRDLSGLFKQGFLLKMGRARATRYTIARRDFT